MSKAEDDLDGVEIGRTTDGRKYEIDTGGGQLALVPESDNQQTVTISAGQLRLALTGGTYYVPNADGHEVRELLGELA